MKRSWRLIDYGQYDGATNMAIDEYMMSYVRRTKRPVLRFYGWQQPTLSLGYAQKAERVVDFVACQRLQVPWVRRPTGGRAVLHAKEVTYAVAMPLDFPDLPEGVVASYKWLSTAIVTGLRKLGLEVALTVPQGRASKSASSAAACFDSPSFYEVVSGGKKIVGSAQVRRQGALLQHGSIMLVMDSVLLSALLSFSSEAARRRYEERLQERAGGLQSVCGREFVPQEVVDAVVAGFEETLAGCLDLVPLTRDEYKEVTALTIEKYQSRQWNWRNGVSSQC